MGKNNSNKEISHLLVIRLSAMGDVAMTAPVILALTKQYPALKITILTRTFFKPMFSQFKNVSVFEADVKGKHKGVFGLWKLYKELKTLKVDAVADLHNVVRSNILKRFFKIGSVLFVQIDKGRAEKKALTASNNKVFKQLKTTIERYVEVFKGLDLTLDMTTSNFLEKRPLPEKSTKIIGADAKKWIGIAPFAAFQGKMYPERLMLQVLQQLNNTNKYKILLFGGGTTEKEKLQAWGKELENTFNMVGEFSFTEELALISNLDVMLAMDSGNAHLSALFGKPTVTLWGVTHPYAGFYPYGQNTSNGLLSDRDKFPMIPTSVYGNKFPKGYENAMETISPEIVVSKIITILES